MDLTNGEGGVIKYVLKEGVKPITSKNVIVHIVGKTEDDKIFYSSRKQNKPLECKLGEDQLNKGLEIAINSMKNEGEISKFIISSKYSYNEKKLIYEIELLKTIPTDKKEWNIEERIKSAMKLKDDGNFEFKEKNFKKASVRYKQALRLLDFNEKKKEIEELKLICLTNLAASELKLSKYENVIKTCTNALKIDENNMKALYRRAQAFMNLEEFEKSKQDFDKILNLKIDENTRKLVLKDIEKLKQLKTKYDNRMKKSLKGMFK